jgi:hypothetical protein
LIVSEAGQLSFLSEGSLHLESVILRLPAYSALDVLATIEARCAPALAWKIFDYAGVPIV